MKKLMLAVSALIIGTTGPAFAAGDETGGGITDPGARTTTTYSTPSTAPEAGTEDMTLLEYFLALLAEWDD